MGDNCKLQNNVSVYKGVTLEDGVFCGPSMVFTNVYNPRAEIKKMDQARPTLVKRGASIGANATIVCGNTLGRYCFIGAGAVVTKNVPDHALVVGNPAKGIGWVCKCGENLSSDLKCVECGMTYEKGRDGGLFPCESGGLKEDLMSEQGGFLNYVEEENISRKTRACVAPLYNLGKSSENMTIGLGMILEGGIREILRKKIFRQTGVLFVSQVSSIVLMIVSGIISTRLLGLLNTGCTLSFWLLCRLLAYFSILGYLLQARGF